MKNSIFNDFFTEEEIGVRLDEEFDILQDREDCLIYELEDESSEGNVLILEEN
jgi:hypothetical protein